MQDYINEILHRINEEMELLGIDENVCVEDALHMTLIPQHYYKIFFLST